MSYTEHILNNLGGFICPVLQSMIPPTTGSIEDNIIGVGGWSEEVFRNPKSQHNELQPKEDISEDCESEITSDHLTEASICN